MNLAFRLSGHEAIVYRKPCGVIAFTLFMAAICLAGGMGFGLIGYRELKSLAGMPFMAIGTIFGVFGLLMIFDVVRKSPTWLHDGGVPLAKVSKSGLTIWPNFNAKPQTYTWSAITAIILADALQTIDGTETDFTRSQFIVFLSPDAIPASIIGKITAQLRKSGESKAYVSTDFQPASARELETALRRLAPASVEVRRCKRAIFDRKANTDRYENP